MKKLLLLAAALSLGGCASLKVIAGLDVSPKAVIVASNTFDGLEITATKYLQLPACVNGGPIVCRNSVAVAKLVPAIKSGRTARNTLESLLAANNNAAIPVASFNTLQTAISSITSIVSQYNIAQ